MEVLKVRWSEAESGGGCSGRHIWSLWLIFVMEGVFIYILLAIQMKGGDKPVKRDIFVNWSTPNIGTSLPNIYCRIHATNYNIFALIS